jgi:chemotaxis methyl-accepting protein methylase
MTIWVWGRLPASLGEWKLVRAYGAHLHSLIQLQARRQQSVGTFFFRNRFELDLLIRLLREKPEGAMADIAILACSKGAEVYSFSYAIRSARPDLKVRLCALDISKEVLEFAKAGVYSLENHDGVEALSSSPPSVVDEGVKGGDVATGTAKDQPSSIFERMSREEIETMFDREKDLVIVKPQYREGIEWHLGNAGDPALVGALGRKDVVVANRFLCHMHPEEAERCLRQLTELVKLDGYLFISGVDLGVRSKVAQEVGLTPVTELIEDIHEGDQSLRRDWPLRYWGLEPIDERRPDWKMRYASVFQRQR